MLTEQQQAFVSQFLKCSLFSKKRDRNVVTAFERYANDETRFKTLSREIPRDHPEMRALIAALAPVLAAKNSGQFDAAGADIAALVQRGAVLKTTLQARRQAVLDQLPPLASPPGTPADRQQALQAERDTVTAAMGADGAAALPALADFLSADQALQTLAGLVRDTTTALQDHAALAAALAQVAAPAMASATAAEALAVQAQRDLLATVLADAAPSPQAIAAGRQALAALSLAIAQATQAMATRQQAALAQLAAVAAPVGATSAEAAAIGAETARIQAALADPLHDDPGLAATTQALSALQQTVQQAIAAAAARRQAVVTRLATLSDPWGAPPLEQQALQLHRDTVQQVLALAAPTARDIARATTALDALDLLIRQTAARAVQRRQGNVQRLAALQADPAGATPAELQAIGQLRSAAKALIDIAEPASADMDAGVAALDALRDAIEAAKVQPAAGRPALARLGAAKPQAAARAAATLQGFTAVIGALDVTPAVFADAQTALTAAHQSLADAKAALQAAAALPQGTAAEALHRRKELARLIKLRDTARGALATTKARSGAIMGRKLLSDALLFGGLAPDAPGGLSDDSVTKFAAAFGKDPLLADTALKTARSAEHPKAIADNIGALCDRSAAGFKGGGLAFSDPDFARGYAEKLLKMGGSVGPALFDAMPAYLDAGRQFQPDPLAGGRTSSWAAIAQDRCRLVAGKMIQPDGSVDPGAAAADMQHLMLHPGQLRYATPALMNHLLKTQAFLTDPTTGPQAKAVLDAANASAGAPAAAALVRGTTGGDPAAPVTDQQVKAAILTALLTPMTQGPVGSCFSTAPCRRLRETQPLAALQAFAELATQGSFQPAGADRTPAVTRTPPDENPLLRSLEYTLATAAARKVGSDRKTALTRATNRGVELLAPLVDPADWTVQKNALRTAVSAAFSFVYDPLSAITDANDGTSTQGRYVVQRISDGSEITTRDQFVQAMTGIALDVLAVDPATPEGVKVVDLVKSDPFVDAVCAGRYKPWEQSSGGQTEEAAAALFGGSVTTRDLLAAGAGTEPEGQRTAAVLAGLLNAFQGRADTMATVRTVGQHGFNALPNHPSLAALKGADAAETAARLQSELIAAGVALRNRELAAEHAAQLFDTEMARRIAEERNAELKALLTTASTSKRPTAAARAADVDRILAEALQPYGVRKTELEADAWSAQQTAAGKTVDAPVLAAHKAKLQATHEAALRNVNKSLLVAAMGGPEFVIADTNWGNPQSETLFVVAPDPVTGEPLLWQKKQPPGKLVPAGREWVDKQWARVE